MSTTNPNTGGTPSGVPAPGAGPKWPADAADLNKPDDSGGGGGVDRASVARGHEADVFAVKPILAIPVAVAVTFVVAFGVATAVFAYVMRDGIDRTELNTNPMAATRNERPLDERLADINHGKRVDQPRLEPLQLLDGDGKGTTRLPLDHGNPPLFHPEQLLPGNIAASPADGVWTAEQRAFAAKVVGLVNTAASNPATKSALFPVRKDPVKPDMTAEWVGYPSAGRGGAAVKPADHTHDGHNHGKKDAEAPKPKDKE